MESVMKKIIIIIVLVLVSFSCSKDGSDNGGQGADFDASQYYTKTEVDQLLDQRFNNFSVHTTYYANDTGGSITSTGSANGYDITVPQSDCQPLVSVTAENTGTAARTLVFRHTGGTETPKVLTLTLQAGEKMSKPYLLRITDVSASGVTTLYADAAESDLTDVTLSAGVTFWFCHVTGLNQLN